MRTTNQYKLFVNELQRKLNAKKKDILFLCIGSNRIIGDCFGPMVGSHLDKLKFNKKVKVLGNMNKPICATNINKELKKVKKDYYVVAIDSALSEYSNQGIYISNQKMTLGNGIDKKIVKVGNISIKACVGNKSKSTIESLYYLKNVNKDKIYSLSLIVSKGICEVLNSKTY